MKTTFPHPSLFFGAALLASAAFPAASTRAAVGLATIRLTTEQATLLADGKSQTILTAEVRDERGAVVPDGTTIRFATTAGRLDTNTALTQNGVARVTLTSADLPGVALVTANLEASGQANAAPVQTTVSFTRDAESAAYAGDNWARIEGSQYTGYVLDFGVVQVNGKNGGARLSFRDIAITADALQVNVRENKVRAVGNVVLARGGQRVSYRTLRYQLLTGQGVAERDEEGKPRPVSVQGPDLEEKDPDPAEPTSAESWELEDISGASVVIVAQSIGLEPNARLQFRRAAFYLDNNKTLTLPFHVLSLGQESLFAEQIVGFGPQGVTVDFPLYYDVRPSAVGTLHVRRGARVGSSAYSTRPGWSLDMEQDYNARSSRGSGGASGGGTNGTIALNGLTRQDWGARWNHGQSIGPSARGNLYVDFPNHRDLFASTNLSRAFKGFSLNASASGSRIQVLDVAGGTRTAGGDIRAQVYAETDPRAALGTPRVQYALNLSTARQGFYGPQRENLGGVVNTQTAGMRLFTSPLPISLGTTLAQSLSIGQTWTRGGLATGGGRSGASVLGTTALTRSLGRLGTGAITYDYTQTPLLYGSYTGGTGRHRLGGNLFLGAGEKWNLSLAASHSLDRVSSTLYGNLQFSLGGPWRGRVTLSGSRVPGFRYGDAEYALIRRIAGRDVAVYYSTTSRRFQFDFTGARF